MPSRLSYFSSLPNRLSSPLHVQSISPSFSSQSLSASSFVSYLFINFFIFIFLHTSHDLHACNFSFKISNILFKFEILIEFQCHTLLCGIFLLLVGWDQVPCTAVTSGLLYQPQMIGEGDCGAIGGMKIGRGNQITRRKPAPAPVCPPQIPLDQTRDRTPAAAV
jgi:hypothetical protein